MMKRLKPFLQIKTKLFYKFNIIINNNSVAFISEIMNDGVRLLTDGQFNLLAPKKGFKTNLTVLILFGITVFYSVVVLLFLSL